MGQQTNKQQPVRSNSSQSGGRHGKRRRVRYDRLLIALAIVIALLFLMGSCTCSCIQCACGTSEPAAENEGTTAASTESTDTTESTQSESQNAVSMALTETDMHKGPLAVVNASTEYLFPAEDVNLVSVYERRNGSYSVSSMDVELDEEAVEHLNMLLSEFSTIYGNTDIQVESGYRSKQNQQERYSNGSSIFPGGFSDYHTARSLDLNICSDTGSSYYVPSGDYAWITEHAHEYGYVVRYPDGKMDSTGVNPRAYTFHYVGLPHSVYMYEKSLCLEEYVEEMKEYSATSPLVINADGTAWTVFYVEASASGNTVVNIPSCEEYTVSGDNIGGFIVAYH